MIRTKPQLFSPAKILNIYLMYYITLLFSNAGVKVHCVIMRDCLRVRVTAEFISFSIISIFSNVYGSFSVMFSLWSRLIGNIMAVSNLCSLMPLSEIFLL